MEKLLEVKNLCVSDLINGDKIIKDVSFYVKPNTSVAIVGESGSGKSMTVRSVMGINKPWLYSTGSIIFEGKDLLELSEEELRKIRGKEIYMIFQDGMSAFDPTYKIKSQMREVLGEKLGYNKEKSDESIINSMEKIFMKDAKSLINKYPHQLSGGMLQRIMIALGLSLSPKIIIADEPTTALDAITKFEVLKQFANIKKNFGTSFLFISHDLGVVKKVADDVIVMKDGTVVEKNTITDIFEAPEHEYTKYLINTKKKLNDKFNEIMVRKND